MRSAAFSNDGKWLLTGSADNTARVWDVASGKLLLILSGHSGRVESVAFSPDGTTVATGSVDGTARLWSVTADNQQQSFSAPAGITTSALAPDGKAILVGDVDGNTGLWDLNTGQLLRNFPKGVADVKSVAFSPNGRLVAIPEATSANSYSVKLYDPSTGILLKTFTAGPSSQPFIGALTFSSDSKMIFAWSLDNNARLWDVASGQVLRLFQGSGGPGTLSPDGKFVTDGGQTWWNISAGREINFPNAMKGNRILFSADGSLFAVADFATDAAVWKVSTQQLVNRFSGHTDQVTSMAISPDNRLLLTGSADKTVRLWDIATGRLLRVFSGHTAAVTSVAFTPDGKRIITGSMDRTIQTWIADYNDLVAYACTRVGRDFTTQERTLYAISDQEPTCPQFGKQSQPLLPTTTPVPTRTPVPVWTPLPTPTSTTTANP